MERTKCEIWSRCVGYMRPVEQWNQGKQEEFRDRKTFDRQLSVQSMAVDVAGTNEEHAAGQTNAECQCECEIATAPSPQCAEAGVHAVSNDASSIKP